MCNNSCSWIIIILLLLSCCGGCGNGFGLNGNNGDCGCNGCGNGCGC